MLKLMSTFAFSVCLLLSAGMGGAFAGDPLAGEKYYKKKCKSCHGKLVEGGKHGSGPNLWGVTLRVAGKAEGFRKYSKGLAAADFQWTDENLDKWLAKPKDFIPGARMVMKIKKAKDRANLIAYLKSAR